MRGYIKEEHTNKKCTVCGKNGLLKNRKCTQCHEVVVFKIFKRWFMGFVEQERHRNMSQEEFDNDKLLGGGK